MDIPAVMTAVAAGSTVHQLHHVGCIVQHEQHEQLVMCVLEQLTRNTTAKIHYQSAKPLVNTSSVPFVSITAVR